MKGLRLNIYKPAYGDSSNSGISSQCASVTLIGDDIAEIFEADDTAPAVHIVKRKLFGRDYYHVEPVNPCTSDQIGYMHGGCFVSTSDSRFKFDYPLALHDRCEEQEQYDSLSR